MEFIKRIKMTFDRRFEKKPVIGNIVYGIFTGFAACTCMLGVFIIFAVITGLHLSLIHISMRDLNLDGWQDQYGSVIKKLRNNILKDPTDINAMILRVRCLIDTEQFDEAEEKCKYLKEELQKPLMEELNEAKNGGK